MYLQVPVLTWGLLGFMVFILIHNCNLPQKLSGKAVQITLIRPRWDWFNWLEVASLWSLLLVGRGQFSNWKEATEGRCLKWSYSIFLFCPRFIFVRVLLGCFPLRTCAWSTSRMARKMDGFGCLVTPRSAVVLATGHLNVYWILESMPRKGDRIHSWERSWSHYYKYDYHQSLWWKWAKPHLLTVQSFLPVLSESSTFQKSNKNCAEI